MLRGTLTVERRGAQLHPSSIFSVACRNFPLNFGVFLEPLKRDEMTLRFSK